MREAHGNEETRTRANIHGIVAGLKGATILDIGFQFPDPGVGTPHRR